MQNEKREYRRNKRELKKAGNRDVRNFLKRQLRDNPEEAHWDEVDYGDNSTEHMNGKYKDSTRNDE